MPVRPPTTCPRLTARWFVPSPGRWIVLLVMLSFGCRTDVVEPTAGHLELCCKAANEDNLSFVGCRASSVCRARETIWLRGPVSCSAPTDECAGGRCCRLDLEAVNTLGLAVDDVTGPVEAEPEPAPEPERRVAPEPAPIIPVPFDG